MRSLLRAAFLGTAAATVAVLFYLFFTTAPPALHLDGGMPKTQVLGGYHIHTARSDGTGTVDDVAAAAARAGLSFIVLTDHGDGTRQPDPPSYRHGVLCIDAVEISTDAGHVVALGLSDRAPYPLAGNPRDVIDDIHRLGGQAVLAHPDSPKPELRWRGQNADFDGIEWLNIDSEWRDETPSHLVATAIRSIVRSPESIASLFQRPVRTLARWDTAARVRPVFGLAALDAHARIGWQQSEEPRQRTAFARPTYEAMFRTLAQVAVLDAPLSNDPALDASRVLSALTGGRSFSIVRAFADPASLEFTAEQAGATALMGARLPLGADGTTFRATVPQAPGARVTLFADGRPVATATGRLERAGLRAPGVYRVEVTLPGQTSPWIVSNPIVIGPPTTQVTSPDVDAAREDHIPLPGDPQRWAVERDPASSAGMISEGAAMRFGFQLAPGVPRGQYAALVVPVDTELGVARVQFVARADRPMRLSLQLRLPGGRDEDRWRRSVYVDTVPRVVAADLQEFEPVDASITRQPIVAKVHTVLFVADTVNTLPGTAGVVWISELSLGVRQP